MESCAGVVAASKGDTKMKYTLPIISGVLSLALVAAIYQAGKSNNGMSQAPLCIIGCVTSITYGGSDTVTGGNRLSNDSDTIGAGATGGQAISDRETGARIGSNDMSDEDKLSVENKDKLVKKTAADKAAKDANKQAVIDSKATSAEEGK